MHIFSQLLYDNVFTISLIFPEENNQNHRLQQLIVFIKFYIKIFHIFGVYLYVKITSEYSTFFEKKCENRMKCVSLQIYSEFWPPSQDIVWKIVNVHTILAPP